MEPETVYCLAKCANTTCDQHNTRMDQHGDNATADYYDRCKQYVQVKASA